MATYFSAELILEYLVRTRALIIEIKLLLIKEKSNYFNTSSKKYIWESKYISCRTNQFIGV